MCNCCNQGLAVVNEPFYCPRRREFIIRGPRGATGAQGPQGPQGLNGTISNNATFAFPSEVGVLSDGALPLTTVVTLNGNKISQSLSLNSITLTAGTYLINYNTSILGEGATNSVSRLAVGQDVRIGIAIDGIINQNLLSVVTQQNGTQSLGGNAVITLPNTSELSLVNASGDSIEISNLILSIINLT